MDNTQHITAYSEGDRVIFAGFTCSIVKVRAFDQNSIDAHFLYDIQLPSGRIRENVNPDDLHPHQERFF